MMTRPNRLKSDTSNCITTLDRCVHSSSLISRILTAPPVLRPLRLFAVSTENHVLRPLNTPGEFRTMNGKTVSVLGNKVRTVSGFKNNNDDAFSSTSASDDDFFQRRRRRPARPPTTDDARHRSHIDDIVDGADASHNAAVESNLFRRPHRTARILYTHDVYRRSFVVDAASSSAVTSEDEATSSSSSALEVAFHVLFLNKPLEGGIEAPGDSDEMTPAMINKYVALFKAHSELESVFGSLDHFISSMLTVCRRGQHARVQPSLRECVRRTICSARDLIVASFEETSPAAVKRRWKLDAESASFRVQVQEVVESYVMRRLHRPIFALCQSRAKTDDRKLCDAVMLHRNSTKSAFGVCEEFDCSTAAAENELRRIDTCRTPLEKAQCLAATSTLIKSAVEDHYRRILERHPDRTYKEFATDDLLSIIIYVLVRVGNVRTDLFACFEYIETFHFSSITTTALGFHVAHFQVCSEWLLKDLETNGAFMREKKRRKSSSVLTTTA